jgi:hypothetical protein
VKVEAKPGSNGRPLQHKDDPESLILMAEDEWVLPRLKAINPAVGEIDVTPTSSGCTPTTPPSPSRRYAQILFSLAVDLDYEEHNAMMDEHDPVSRTSPEDDRPGLGGAERGRRKSHRTSDPMPRLRPRRRPKTSPRSRLYFLTSREASTSLSSGRTPT